MKTLQTKDIIRRLEHEGWIHKYTRGSHATFGRTGTPQIITVVISKRTQSIGVLRNIARLAGWTWPLE